jgi:hypothetical protein
VVGLRAEGVVDLVKDGETGPFFACRPIFSSLTFPVGYRSPPRSR